MSINIGDNNKIKNSTIAESIGQVKEPCRQKGFYASHPVICSILISLAVGIFLMFHFWDKIIALVEAMF